MLSKKDQKEDFGDKNYTAHLNSIKPVTPNGLKMYPITFSMRIHMVTQGIHVHNYKLYRSHRHAENI